MCIIAVKEKGYPMFDEEQIRQMFNRNPDGAGLMYRTQSGMIHIEKGFMDIASLLDYVEKHEKTLDNSDVIMHCRISTSGKTDALGTHPYPVWSKNNRVSCDVKLAMAHNGILDNYGWHGNKQINDTQVFIKTCLRKLPHNFLRNKAICDLIAKSIGTNKLAFLSKDGIHLFGDFENPEKGYYYSNHSYAKNEYRYGPLFTTPSVREKKVNDDFYSLYDDCVDGSWDSDYFPDYEPATADDINMEDDFPLETQETLW